MKAVKCTKDGVVIPLAWVKGWGKPVVAYRSAEVVILAASRKQLATMIRKVRRAAKELGPLSPEQIATEVAAVRAQRARRS
jgi:type 1 glutamine amidotransferase